MSYPIMYACHLGSSRSLGIIASVAGTAAVLISLSFIASVWGARHMVSSNAVFKMPSPWEHDSMVNPGWRQGSGMEGVPIGDSKDYLARLQDVRLQRHQAAVVQHMQANEGMEVLPPCNWCGQPTGDWCERCHSLKPNLLAHHICTRCDASIRMCRLCRLEVRASGHFTIRPEHDSAWMGTSVCGSCGLARVGYKVCGGCGVIRYCGRRCQKKHWDEHQPLCQFLQRDQPVSFVYPWHAQRLDSIVRRDPAMVPPPLMAA